MTISPGTLSLLITLSSIVVGLTPIILLALWIKDKKEKQLW
jgi:hypothetical protein